MQIVFSNTNSLLSYAVRGTTFSRWSQVDMLFDDGTLIGASPRRSGQYAAGVQKMTLKERLENDQVACYKIDEVKLREPDATRRFLERQIGKPHDTWGLFGMAFHARNWQDDSCWFGAELVAAAAQAGCSPLIRGVVTYVSPNMVENSHLLTSVVPITHVNKAAKCPDFY